MIDDSLLLTNSEPFILTLSPQERTFTGSSNASMRTNLNERLAKLHVKHQAEIDFLEDIRSTSHTTHTLLFIYSAIVVCVHSVYYKMHVTYLIIWHGIVPS